MVSEGAHGKFMLYVEILGLDLHILRSLPDNILPTYPTLFDVLPDFLMLSERLYCVSTSCFCLKVSFLRFAMDSNKLFSQKGYVKFSFPLPFSNRQI